MATVMVKGPASTAEIFEDYEPSTYAWSCECGQALPLGVDLSGAVQMAELHVDEYCPKLKDERA